MTPALKRLQEAWQLGLALPPSLSVSEWADAKRVIARGTGPEPGRWNTARAPYLREPMNAVLNPDVRDLVLMWSSQVGKTEIGINIAAYFIDQDPSPQMFVLPTLELGDSFSTKRFRPTVEATPALLDKIGYSVSRDSSDTIREKAYPGGDIVFAGANSAASLASRPRRLVVFDEIDKYKAAIGNDGDPIAQGMQRTENFYNRKHVLCSTPTLTGMSAIETWWLRSDQRLYFVPCPGCGELQPLEWDTATDGGREPRVRWQKGKPETAHYVCVHNGCAIDQRDLVRAVEQGQWRPTSTPGQIRGYHINSLASPWVTMERLAAQWEQAEGKPAEEQTFVNLKLGRPYSPMKGAESTAKQLLARKEDFGPDKLPPEVLLITAFVDVQSDRFECQYLGWGLLDEKWVIDYAVHWADPTNPSAWAAMDASLLQRTFPHPAGGDLVIEAIGIDAGFLQTKVLEFCREQRVAFRPFYAVKGVSGFGRALWKESEEKFKRGARLYLSGIDDGKQMTFQEVAVVDPRPRVHFARHLEIGYFEQLIESEKIKAEIKAGRPVPKWMPVPGKRNEALDTFVGAMAVRYSLSIDYEARRNAMSGTARAAGYADIATMFKR